VTAPVETHDIGKLSLTNVGQRVIVHGYLGPGKRRDMSKKLSFWDISSRTESRHVQLVSFQKAGQDEEMAREWLKLPPESPVAITGTVQEKQLQKMTPEELARVKDHEKVEISLEGLVPLNIFPQDVEVLETTNYPPSQRHLEIRKKPALKDALKFRSQAASLCRDVLRSQGFLEVETPMLFKSTPEGAREFLVPTRRKGLAYALPQSPQQYKQILMASGIPKYYQFARCFRDEDLRADRQPEFTQIDLEMAFADEEWVMNAVENIVRTLWLQLLAYELPTSIPRMSYQEAMSTYGSDKPDTRFDMKILNQEASTSNMLIDILILPSNLPEAFIRECLSEGTDVANDKHVVSLAKYGTSIYSSDPPTLSETLNEGGILVSPRATQLTGGSTAMGRFRNTIHQKAVKAGLLPKPAGFHFLWVTDFPLFQPTNDVDPGQGGTAGLTSTHHPFTSPATPNDVDLLGTDPLRVKGAHYDLVVNGVELGGGSRRIHVAAVQEYVFREVLRMPESRIADFKHLLDVLAAGCPPHAGIALGFDRLIAVMKGLDSIRDVIAFPKTSSGEDALVGSPNEVTAGQLETYHLKVHDGR
jgi:aspartyl-tRNA synthetase